MCVCVLQGFQRPQGSDGHTHLGVFGRYPFLGSHYFRFFREPKGQGTLFQQLRTVEIALSQKD